MENAAEYIALGARGEARETSGRDNLASRYGSGALDVYSTPAMVALMERASVNALGEALPAGWTTVGISLDVRHLEATPPGMEVVARAELREIKGLRLVFDVIAEDGEATVGTGTHQRYCVEADPFLAAAHRKLEEDKTHEG